MRTFVPLATHALRSVALPAVDPWSTTIADRDVGPVRLTGALSGPRSGTALVMVHGLGGNHESHYMLEPVRAAHRLSMACLRLNLRGADGSGDDFYNAGLTSDVHAAIASPELAGFERILLLGFSLGGHIALRFAMEFTDPRVAAVAAICPPIDLSETARDIDRPERAPYRAYIMRSLRAMHAAVARRGRSTVSIEEGARLRYIRDWDQKVVVPRWGYASREDYYHDASAGPRLSQLRLPSLIVAAEHDPMVPSAHLRRHIERASTLLTLRWAERAGHLGFPRGIDLDVGARDAIGVNAQVIEWLSSHAPRRAADEATLHG